MSPIATYTFALMRAIRSSSGRLLFRVHCPGPPMFRKYDASGSLYSELRDRREVDPVVARFRIGGHGGERMRCRCCAGHPNRGP